MGSGAFPTLSDHGARWWSHRGLVAGYASLLASTDSFTVAVMSNDSCAENLITEVFAHVAAPTARDRCS